MLLSCVGTKYVQPPPLPSNHVKREVLLNEIATKLLQTAIDPNTYEATLCITGIGGFGKTTAVTSLCYHHSIKEHFTDGFIFIDLGPQATDPIIKLTELYNLLTDEQCGMTVVEQKINQLTRDYYCNLLVIIDDVWHVEDAEPLVKAFSNCKTILTTRMNDIEQYIPSKQSVTIGPMMEDEAISLLTSGVIDRSQLSQEDMSLLSEISQDVHCWPLLLSLIKGQLSHNLNKHRFSYHKAIENVKAKLHHKGLTAFDKNNIETVKKGRKLAVKACIEVTLEILTKSLANKIKILILWNGIGTALQTGVLNGLWNTSEQEAENSVNTLWTYGLVQFTDNTISPNNVKQHCVEVHAVISQYIIECTDSNEVMKLSSFNAVNFTASVGKELELLFMKAYGINNLGSLSIVDYLKFKLSEIESGILPYYLKTINSHPVIDPHLVIFVLNTIKNALITSPYGIDLLSLFDQEIDALMTDCKQMLIHTHRLCRNVCQTVQKSFHERNYNKVIESIEKFIKNYPLCKCAQKVVIMVKKIMQHCVGTLLDDMMRSLEFFQVLTPEYHEIAISTLPNIKLFIRLHRQIASALLSRSADIELMYHYFESGKFDEDNELVKAHYLIKLQEVAPKFVLHYGAHI